VASTRRGSAQGWSSLAQGYRSRYAQGGTVVPWGVGFPTYEAESVQRRLRCAGMRRNPRSVGCSEMHQPSQGWPK